MTHTAKRRLPITLLILHAVCFSSIVHAELRNADAPTLAQASWSPLTIAQVKEQVEAWLASREVDESVRQQVSPLWNNLETGVSAEEAHRRLVATFALIDPAANELVSFCQAAAPAIPRSFEVLQRTQPIDVERNNLRLLYGAWLTQNAFYDEAAEQLEALAPGDVVDPASLLFHQAVVAQRLLKKEESLSLLGRLLEKEAALPRRYAIVAKLMQHDLEPLKPDSLDEISRMMDDVRRRLDLGRAGKKVREEEAEIIAKLDKKIDDLEKQQQQQQQMQQQQQSGQARDQAAKPAEQSQAPRDIKANDEVDAKQLGKANNWGNLPPKQRQQALQQISRELPSHFRDTIEEYFKRLAQDGNE